MLPSLMIGFMIFCAQTSAVFAESVPVISADSQYAYAKHLMGDKDFARAAVEFDRFVFFYPTDPKRDQAVFHQGKSWFEAGMYARAVNALSAVDINSDFYFQSRFLTARSHELLKDPGSAIVTLRNVISPDNPQPLNDKLFNQIGWITLKAGDISHAIDAFSKVSADGNSTFQSHQIADDLKKAPQQPKNPVLAGILSAVFPGAGYAYCHRYRDGTVSFLLNVAMIFAAAEAFRHDNNALGGVITFVETGFYAGNIYGSAGAAHKFNQRQKQLHYIHIDQKYDRQID